MHAIFSWSAIAYFNVVERAAVSRLLACFLYYRTPASCITEPRMAPNPSTPKSNHNSLRALVLLVSSRNQQPSPGVHKSRPESAHRLLHLVECKTSFDSALGCVRYSMECRGGDEEEEDDGARSLMSKVVSVVFCCSKIWVGSQIDGHLLVPNEL
jgi:hypothetical protein